MRGAAGASAVPHGLGGGSRTPGASALPSGRCLVLIVAMVAGVSICHSTNPLSLAAERSAGATTSSSSEGGTTVSESAGA